ncbi:MAG: Transcriptional regulatory protein ZraR [Syntrophorhabdus sp. PtaU1.Bin153]|nr:MAG: Transcriptional regulatory protein ZraR [Syntrophorhabdus sp. PtaU1.Bin153]
MQPYKILIVDDDKLLRNSLQKVLSGKYETVIAGSGEAALDILRANGVDLALLDIRLPGIDGVETLRRIRELDRNLAVVMMTAYEDVKTVVHSMKMGATDYLVKPLDIEELEVIIDKAVETIKLKKEVEALRKQYIKDFDIDNIIGESDGIKAAMKLVNTIAKSHDTTVLLEGETGTGKEVLARAIHTRSSRFGKPFVTINCGAISKDLVESELFGYEKGTFTGGLSEGKKGKFEIADGGTLLLDEVSELLPASQVKLLRFLEEKAFYRVGGTDRKRVDVRIVAATNKKLEDAVKEGVFRSDLYYRLNVAKIYLPPLRERREDIIPLIHFFMERFNESFGKNFTGLSREAHEMLLNYHWAGNVRELRNVIERVVLLEEGPLIELEHLAFLPQQEATSQNREKVSEIQIPPTGISLDELSKKLIIQALEMSKGNKSKAAKLLGMSRATLLYRIDKFGIQAPMKQ